jgi:hypothetical protein
VTWWVIWIIGSIVLALIVGGMIKLAEKWDNRG